METKDATAARMGDLSVSDSCGLLHPSPHIEDMMIFVLAWTKDLDKLKGHLRDVLLDANESGPVSAVLEQRLGRKMPPQYGAVLFTLDRGCVAEIFCSGEDMFHSQGGGCNGYTMVSPCAGTVGGQVCILQCMGGIDFASLGSPG